jgi:pyruvate,water dikinase
MSPFIWLGSKRAKKAGVGHKGALLDYAAKMGLPVPNGGIILHEFYLYALENGLVRTENHQLTAPDPSALAQTLFDTFRLPRLDKPVALRSAFAAEDTNTSSLAGYFTSKLHIDSRDPVSFGDSLREVWSSADKQPGSFRRDVLMMEMVAAQVAGVAFTEAAYADDLINFSQGTADKLVSGLIEGETRFLPQLQRGEWPTAHEPFARRLQLLLRGVRRTFGPGNSATDWHGDWDIEWADDGQVCWLVQVRPATRPTRRNEAFTHANFKEILPDPPSPYLTSAIMSAAPDLFAYYRQFDPTLPTHRPMIELFAGRPLFNMTLLTDVMRWWGLPTRLVNNSIGGQADVDIGLHWGRFFRKTLVLLKQGWAQARAVTLAQQQTERLRWLVELGGGEQSPPSSLHSSVTSDPLSGEDGFAAANETFRQLFVGLVQGMFALTAAMSGPLLILRHTGTLTEHSARLRTIGTTLLTDLDPIREYVVAHPEIQPDLLQGDLPDDAGFRDLWQVYLDKHGHRGIYESDVARPRYREAPEPLLQSLAYPSRGLTPPPARTWKGWLTWPVWWQCGRVMQAREQFRYEVMYLFQHIRQRLLALAGQAVAQGQLPDVESFWLLTLEESAQLDHGHRFDLDFLARRRHEVEHWRGYDLPDLIHRFDNLEQYRQGEPLVEGNGPVSGISLTTGRVRGRAWVLSEPDHQLPGGFTPEQTILVARSVDAGWLPTFNQVAGVIVDIGGDLSHGSIILRELGLPSMTNCGRATRIFQTGDEVELDAGRGQAWHVL